MTIPFSIRSVLEQTFGDFLLHVVGDGCGDDTVAAVTAIGDPRIRIHRFEKTRGAAMAHINTVLKRTSAPFIAYITDDDLWFPDHLSSALAELQRSSEALVAFRPAAILPPDQIDAKLFPFDWNSRLWKRLLQSQFIGLETYVHRREVLEEAGYWSDRVLRFADCEFYNRVRKSPAGTRYIDKITVLRFYARHWSHLYRPNDPPPQEAFLKRLRESEWREKVRAAAHEKMTPRVRTRQIAEFTRLAVRSGIPFLRRLHAERRS